MIMSVSTFITDIILYLHYSTTASPLPCSCKTDFYTIPPHHIIPVGMSLDKLLSYVDHTCVKHGGVVYVQPIYKVDMDKAYVRLSCELHVQSMTQISDCISHTFSRQEADTFFPS